MTPGDKCDKYSGMCYSRCSLRDEERGPRPPERAEGVWSPATSSLCSSPFRFSVFG